MHIRNPSDATNRLEMLLEDSYMIFQVICSLIRNPSVGSPLRNPAAHRSAHRSAHVAPAVGFPAIAGAPPRDYKTLALYSFGVKTLRHIWRSNNSLLIVFYAIFFTQIYNALIVWHSKLCEKEQ